MKRHAMVKVFHVLFDLLKLLKNIKKLFKQNQYQLFA